MGYLTKFFFCIYANFLNFKLVFSVIREARAINFAANEFFFNRSSTFWGVNLSDVSTSEVPLDHIKAVRFDLKKKSLFERKITNYTALYWLQLTWKTLNSKTTVLDSKLLVADVLHTFVVLSSKFVDFQGDCFLVNVLYKHLSSYFWLQVVNTVVVPRVYKTIGYVEAYFVRDSLLWLPQVNEDVCFDYTTFSFFFKKKFKPSVLLRHSQNYFKKSANKAPHFEALSISAFYDSVYNPNLLVETVPGDGVFFNRLSDFYRNFFKGSFKFNIIIYTLFQSTFKLSIYLNNIYNSIFSFNNLQKNYLSYLSANNWHVNCVPITFLHEKAQKAFLNQSKHQSETATGIFIRQYLGGFLENFFQSKVFLKIVPYLDFPHSIATVIRTFVHEYRLQQRAIGAGFFLDEMVTLLWYSLFIKDPKIFLVWLCRSMTRLDIGKHKHVIKLFQRFIIDYTDFFVFNNFLIGLKFDIRGKVGVAGNSKKRHVLFTVGCTSFSRKSHRLEYQQGLVYTDTGVLGATLIYVF